MLISFDAQGRAKESRERFQKAEVAREKARAQQEVEEREAAAKEAELREEKRRKKQQQRQAGAGAGALLATPGVLSSGGAGLPGLASRASPARGVERKSS